MLYVSGSETSFAAALSVESSKRSLMQTIFAAIDDCPAGATCAEIELAYGLKHQTASARIRDLVNARKIEFSGWTRDTPNGRRARVYRGVGKKVDPTAEPIVEIVSVEKVSAATINAKIVETLKVMGPSTCDTIEHLNDLDHQSVSGNLRHMVEDGYVTSTTDYGTTRSGRKAILWQLTGKTYEARA